MMVIVGFVFSIYDHFRWKHWKQKRERASKWHSSHFTTTYLKERKNKNKYLDGIESNNNVVAYKELKAIDGKLKKNCILYASAIGS